MYVDEAATKVDVHVAVTEKTSWFILPIASLRQRRLRGRSRLRRPEPLWPRPAAPGAGQLGQAHELHLRRRPPSLGPRRAGHPGGRGPRPLRPRATSTRTTRGARGSDARRGCRGRGRLGALAAPACAGRLPARHQHVDAGWSPTGGGRAHLQPPHGRRLFVMGFQVRLRRHQRADGLRHGVRLPTSASSPTTTGAPGFDYSKFEARTELYGQGRLELPVAHRSTRSSTIPTSSRGVPITEMLRIGGVEPARLPRQRVPRRHPRSALQLEDQAVLFRGLPIPFASAAFNVARRGLRRRRRPPRASPGGTALDLPGPSARRSPTSTPASASALRVILRASPSPRIRPTSATASTSRASRSRCQSPAELDAISSAARRRALPARRSARNWVTSDRHDHLAGLAPHRLPRICFGVLSVTAVVCNHADTGCHHAHLVSGPMIAIALNHATVSADAPRPPPLARRLIVGLVSVGSGLSAALVIPPTVRQATVLGHEELAEDRRKDAQERGLGGSTGAFDVSAAIDRVGQDAPALVLRAANAVVGILAAVVATVCSSRSSCCSSAVGSSTGSSASWSPIRSRSYSGNTGRCSTAGSAPTSAASPVIAACNAAFTAIFLAIGPAAFFLPLEILERAGGACRCPLRHGTIWFLITFLALQARGPRSPVPSTSSPTASWRATCSAR